VGLSLAGCGPQKSADAVLSLNLNEATEMCGTYEGPSQDPSLYMGLFLETNHSALVALYFGLNTPTVDVVRASWELQSDALRLVPLPGVSPIFSSFKGTIERIDRTNFTLRMTGYHYHGQNTWLLYRAKDLELKQSQVRAAISAHIARPQP